MIPLRHLSLPFLIALLLLAALPGEPALSAPEKDAEGWVPLFNGKDFTGWKIPDPPSGSFKAVKETKNSDGKVIAFVGIEKDKKDGTPGKEVTLWQVKDGMIVGGGPGQPHLHRDRGRGLPLPRRGQDQRQGEQRAVFPHPVRAGLPAGLRGADQRHRRRRDQDRQPVPRWPHQARRTRKDICVDEHRPAQARRVLHPGSDRRGRTTSRSSSTARRRWTSRTRTRPTPRATSRCRATTPAA